VQPVDNSFSFRDKNPRSLEILRRRKIYQRNKMSSASFRQHFDMISMHEPVQNKARFWSSYVGALKGTQDMRADDTKRRRPISDSFDLFPRIFDDVSSTSEDATSRINAPGYRYQPVSRETYGSSPRNIHPTTDSYPSYRPPSRFLPSRK